jgi:hypothetical protein
MKQDEVGGTRSMHGGEMSTKFSSDVLKGRDHMGDLGIDGKSH